MDKKVKFQCFIASVSNLRVTSNVMSGVQTVLQTSLSLVPRPAPSFPSLAVRLSGRGPGTFSHVSDVTGRKAVERL